jgi:hypothetical protein
MNCLAELKLPCAKLAVRRLFAKIIATVTNAIIVPVITMVATTGSMPFLFRKLFLA